jgi:hypothetical protein
MLKAGRETGILCADDAIIGTFSTVFEFGGKPMLRIDKKALKDAGQGVSDGVGTAWQAARKQAGKVEFRTPWEYKKSSGAKPWLIGFALVSALAAIVGGILYYRKRKQVSSRYTMGEEETADAMDSVTREDLASAMQ